MTTSILPAIGSGVTLNFFTCSRAYTVVSVKGKRMVVQQDKVTPTGFDSDGHRTYSYETDTNGETVTLRQAKNGSWFVLGDPIAKGGQPANVGIRREYLMGHW